jgi:hypothetical protein
VEPDDPAATPSDAETSQMPAVPPAKPESDSVVWPEDPWVADGRAADDPSLEGGPVVTSPVLAAWPARTTGEPSVPSHAGLNPTADDPETAQFPTRRMGLPSEPAVMKTTPPQPAAQPDPVEEVHDTVPPAPVADAAALAEKEEVDTADATLETLPPEVAAVEASEEESAGPSVEEAAIEAIAEDEPAAAAGDGEAAEVVAEEREPAEVVAEEREPAEVVAEEREPAEAAAEEMPVAVEATEPEPEPAAEPEPRTEPTPEPAKAEEPEPVAPEELPVEPVTPVAATPAWAGQPATPATPAPAAPFAPAGPAIPSWAPNAPPAAAKPQPDAPTQWPGINVPAWAPQPTPTHPGTANPLPGSSSPYVEAARASQPAPVPAPAQASAPPAAAPAPAPSAPAISAAPAGATPKTSSWEIVDQKRQAEPVRQGPSPEDKSYAEWFAWAKRSGAPAGACHAAAQGAFRALAAGHDMNTAVQWATLAMASPPGLVGQSRQIYCAWYSLGNIDLKLPTAQAHAFANGAIQALEEGADSMGAHQAGLLAAGITGG